METEKIDIVNKNCGNLRVPTLREVIEIIDSLYPRHLAESWDSVGLIVGDEEQEVRSILIAIDPVKDTVEEAISKKVDLLFTHHPLFLFGTKTVAKSTPKGKLVHDLIKNDCALFNAHTNADRAEYGVSKALSQIVPMKNTQVLEDENAEIGLGVIGEIEPMTLKDFAQKVADSLPKTPFGIQVAGETERIVSKVAFSPGSGQSMLDKVLDKKADVFVCADLKHHVASEFMENGQTALVMPTHWASEWPWVRMCKEALDSKFKEKGLEVSVEYSTKVTDPWAIHINTLEEK